jgi:hypothetical protein
VLIAALVLALQDTQLISKLDKFDYLDAIRDYAKAEKQVESEEPVAIAELSRILESRKIERKECYLKIQRGDQYDPPYLFVPFQCRGRARLSLAGKTAAPGEKRALLEAAVGDFEESLKRGVKSSSSYVETARAELKKLSSAAEPGNKAAAPEKALAELRLQRLALVGERKFKSARLLIDRDGASLPEGERKDLLAQTDQECQKYLTQEMGRFRKRLAELSNVAELQALSKDEFDVLVGLPPAAEIPIPHILYDWACRHLDTFRSVWSRKRPPEALLGAASEVSRIEEGSDYPWFKAIESLVFQELKGRLARQVGSSADAARAEREVLRGEIESMLGSWRDFVQDLEPAFRKRNPYLEERSRALDLLVGKLPRDLSEIDAEDLHSCFERFPVEPQLAAAEERLRKLAEQGGWTVESRRRLYTLQVAARSFRMFLLGKTEGEVALSVRDELEKLSHVGGPLEPGRFGPRIKKVFDSLR